MAGGLTVGELTGFVDLDTKGVTRGAAAGEAAASRMYCEGIAELRRMEAERATVHLEVDERGVLRGITTATAAVQGFDGQDATAHLKVTADTAGVDQVTAATGRARDALGRYVAAGERASAASERGESSTRRWSLSM